MFGLGKNKSNIDTVKAELANRIAVGGKQIDAMIGVQLAFAVDNFHTDLSEVWEDAYTRYYLFGAYDSLVCDLPMEIRQKVGPIFIEMGFLKSAAQAFHLSELQAASALKSTFAIQAKHPTYPAIIDGGVDGMEARQGRTALRLLKHLFDVFEDSNY
jgi:hypothetical protein